MKKLLRLFQTLASVLLFTGTTGTKLSFSSSKRFSSSQYLKKLIYSSAGALLLLAGSISAAQSQNLPGTDKAGIGIADVASPGGSLDISFDPGAGFEGIIINMVLQPDGKIIVGGGFSSYQGIPRNSIARLNANGSLDTSFDPGTGFDAVVRSLALQPDGKIVVAGWFNTYNGTPRNYIARLHPDGSLDNSFNPVNTLTDYVNVIALQPDGKIVAGGRFNNGIARLNADGSPDYSFFPLPGFNEAVWSLALQPDGKIIAGGIYTSFQGVSRRYIARLHSNGSLDTSFKPEAGFNGVVTTIMVQSDGKIVVGGGFTSYQGTPRNRVTRLHADGSLDTSFNPETGLNGVLATILLQPDGKIVVGEGFESPSGPPSRLRIARLNTDGSPDNSFQPGNAFNGPVHSIVLQPDGRMVVGGSFSAYNSINRNRIARLHGGMGASLSVSREIKKGLDILVYPNPTADKIFVRLAAPALRATLKITDLTGKFFYMESLVPAATNCEFDLSALPSGLYLVQLNTGDAMAIRKIIKQ